MDQSVPAQVGRVALLIDGDNVAPEMAGKVVLKAARHGALTIKRVYAAAPHLRGWEGTHGFSLRYAQGAKNATDILLTIEAVELAHRGDLAAFILVSSDRDFAPLARWLVERGLMVLGLGGTKAPLDWRKSCSRFEVLEDAQPAERAATEPTASGAPAVRVQSRQTLDEQARAEIAAAGQDGLPLTTFGHRMKGRNFTKADLQEGTWRDYLEARSDTYNVEPKGPNARVKLREATPG